MGTSGNCPRVLEGGELWDWEGERGLDFSRTIVIVGPTGSGKTRVGIELAKKIGGEIISADSRAIYQGMDIGTAKPMLEEREGVPHFGFDLVRPGERFTVADFKQYAEAEIKEIRQRGHIPIIVGGTGLYVDALVFDYQFTDEAKTSQKDRRGSCINYLFIGVKNTSDLRERLEKRLNKIFEQPLYDETQRLVEQYGWENQAMKSNVYQYVWRYLQGEIDLEEAKRLSFYADWHLAKRQMTWFKRNEKINWMEVAKIVPFVIKCIQDEQRK